MTITGSEAKGRTVGNEQFRTVVPKDYDKLLDTLLAKNVTVDYQPDQTPTWANMLISWAPLIVLVGFWIFFMRQMQSGGNQALCPSARAKRSCSRPTRAKEGHVQGRGRH